MNSSFEAPTDWGELLRAYWDLTTALPHLGVRVLSTTGSILFSNAASNQLFYNNPTLPHRGTQLSEFESAEVFRIMEDLIASVADSSLPTTVHQIREGVLVESCYSVWQRQDSDREASVLEISHALTLRPTDPIPASVVRIPHVSWGPLEALTARQLEVLSQLRRGLSQRDAADVLGVSQKTIETHRDQLVRRLNLSSTLEAIRLADRAGLTLHWARTPRVKTTPWRNVLNRGQSTAGGQRPLTA